MWMRTTRVGVAALLLIGLTVLLASCGGGGPTEPPEVTKARNLLDELWKTGANGQLLMVACFSNFPGLDYCVPKYQEALNSNSARQQMEVMTRMDTWNEPAFKEMVRPLLDSEDEITALQAAKILAAYGDAAGLEILEKRIRSGQGDTLNPEVCGLAADLGSEVCLDEAAKDIRSEDEAKRVSAAAALAEIGGAEAAKILRDALGALHGEKRSAAIEALGEISEDPADVDWVLNYIGYRENVLAVIHALGDLGGEKAEDRLRKILESGDQLAEVEAAGALIEMGVLDEDVVAVIEEAAESDSEQMRYLAAKGLALAPESMTRTATLAADMLDDESYKVVGAAISAMKGKATAEHIDALEAAWQRLKGSTDGEGYAESMELILVIAEVPGERSQGILVEALENMNWGRVAQAALAILERHEEQAAPAA